MLRVAISNHFEERGDAASISIMIGAMVIDYSF
jgi:hypothetical protein